MIASGNENLLWGIQRPFPVAVEHSSDACWRQRQLEHVALQILDELVCSGCTSSHRKLKQVQGCEAASVERLWKLVVLLARVQKNTQRAYPRESMYLRELFYQLTPVFGSQSEMARHLDRLLNRIQCPRSDMGIVAESRGWVYFGPGLALQKRFECTLRQVQATADATDAQQPALYRGLIPIPNDVALDPSQYRLVSEPNDGRAITMLIVEKYGIFRNLIDEDLVSLLPASTVLITGCGQPSFATRAFVAHLMRLLQPRRHRNGHAFDPRPWPFLGAYIITDYNPHGLCIARQYRQCVDSFSATATTVPGPSCIPRWIGPRARHLQQLRSSGTSEVQSITGSAAVHAHTRQKPFSQRELALARHLYIDAIRWGDSVVAEELQLMIGSRLWTEQLTKSLPKSKASLNRAETSSRDGFGAWDLQSLILCMGPGTFTREFMPRLLMHSWYVEYQKAYEVSFR
ncbi:Mei-w68p [Cyanidiococcus yangmingshanensis]|uniref:DNA topoisomerase (ATP-hydrolyzing) n=1 Tax=Cyanidiococcus yangmingshanensis TaxID=2690220 RepID=A0A7J7ID25_9RHOD|nr:Mei-w68p [Cyanidiococcus yangmingshanensis]